MGTRHEMGAGEGLEGVGMMGAEKKLEELMFTQITDIKIKWDNVAIVRS